MGTIRRREFGQVLAATGLGLATGASRSEAAGRKERRIPLGFDNYSIRALEWNAPRLIGYAAELGLDSCLLSDLYVYDSHDESYLRGIRAQAEDAGIQLHVGTGSVCPTSSSFKTDFGSAEDHLALTIRIARILGSPVARCFLGSRQDRLGPEGIEPHMKSTVQVFRKLRGPALDAGVRIAIENHAGDMQARETARVIEESGTDFVGATVDSGNATWSLEDPVRNLEILGPYAASSGIRDSMVWEDEAGARVQWAAMGTAASTWRPTWNGSPGSVPVSLSSWRPFPGCRDPFPIWSGTSGIRTRPPWPGISPPSWPWPSGARH